MKLKLFIFAFLALTLFSCTQDAPPPPIQNGFNINHPTKTDTSKSVYPKSNPMQDRLKNDLEQEEQQQAEGIPLLRSTEKYYQLAKSKTKIRFKDNGLSDFWALQTDTDSVPVFTFSTTEKPYIKDSLPDILSLWELAPMLDRGKTRLFDSLNVKHFYLNEISYKIHSEPYDTCIRYFPIDTIFTITSAAENITILKESVLNIYAHAESKASSRAGSFPYSLIFGFTISDTDKFVEGFFTKSSQAEQKSVSLIAYQQIGCTLDK